jgi:two-component system response regulator AtoC
VVTVPTASDPQKASVSDTPEAAPPEFSRILVVDDEEPMRHMLELMLRREGFEVTTAQSAESALELLDRVRPDVILSDVRMPGIGGLGLVREAFESHPEVTIVVMSAFGSVELALEAMKAGAYDYISKPFKQDEVVLTLRKAEERERLKRENARLRASLRQAAEDSDRLGEMLVRSEGMRAVARMVRKVAPFKTTVLVQGESGVGKELVSRALHSFSPRAEGPFVAVNCGAIPEPLLESELFGHVRGAFTDAVSDKLGLFEEASGGTLFLDEIGELPPSVQVKLLRVLQEDEVRRVGATRSARVDVRVVAATSRPLEQMVEEGSFRQDLYYRLNVMPVEIPPLRERRDDVAPLVEHFLESIRDRLGMPSRSVSATAMKAMLAYDWPGNVRELENALEHAAVMADGECIEQRDLPERVGRDRAVPSFALPLSDDDLSVKRAARRLERELILRALERTGGNRTQAAKLLELSHRALLYKIKEFGLN